MDVLTLVSFVTGLAVLVTGAETLVRGASQIAAAAGLSPLAIGLTVVAFGTSAPELSVSMRAAMASEAGADIAIGNVVGSNICNVLLILGLAAAVAPLIVSKRLVQLDIPVMIGVSILLLVFGLDGRIGRLEGGLLFAGVIAFTVFSFVQGRDESDEPAARETAARLTARRLFIDGALIAAGLGMLVLGANWVIDGAVAIARYFGMSELVIGLTLIAGGTSLPEAATSVLASLRGERDIAVGNVVGSNIFNILAVLGFSAIAAPDGIRVASAALSFDIPAMIAVAVACLPIFFTGYRISRVEGFVFLGFYVAYVTYLILEGTAHAMLPAFSAAMLVFVVPLTALTLVIVVVRELRKGSDA